MEYDTKTDRRRLLGISMRVILALVLVGLLVAPIAVQAGLKAVETPYAWDFFRQTFRNSEVLIPWDGTWVPFMEGIPFDAKLFTDLVDPDPDVVGDEFYVCPDAPAGATPWAGLMVYGLAHEDADTDPGARGFFESRKWSLVSCDRDGDGSWTVNDLDAMVDVDGNDLSPYVMRSVLDDCDSSAGYCQIVGDSDRIELCNNQGNCRTEIVTTLLINLDLDCNGAMDDDPNIPKDLKGNLMMCFYAEGRTPPPIYQTIPWSIPLQARLGPVGGDKTISFKIQSITAVELAAFDAAAQENGVMLTWETAAEMDNLGFNIYRADSQVGEMNKINPSLIPSKDPGSTVGAAYSFLDESAVPGATYYYWLEDVDVVGAAEINGPLVAKMGAVRDLPGRGRPAPMPGNAY